jgi:hypothetical protein
MTKIKIKNSTTVSGVPISGSLLQGELAVNITDKLLFVGNSSGHPINLGGSMAAVATGSISGISINASATPAIFSLQDNVFIVGTLQVSGVISTTGTTGSLFNNTALSVNIGADASGVKIGHATGVVVVGDVAVNNGAITTTAATASLFNTTAARVNIGAGASGVLIGNATGVVTVGDLAVNDGTITTTSTACDIFNTTAVRINIGGGASGVQIGHPTGTVVMGNISATGYVSAASGYRLTSSAVNTQTGTTYTLLSTDDGRIITMNNGSSITVTVPTGLNIGFNTTVIQLGAGQVTFATGVGSPTLNSYGSAQKITGQYGAASIISYASNSYNLAGTLST